MRLPGLALSLFLVACGGGNAIIDSNPTQIDAHDGDGPTSLPDAAPAPYCTPTGGTNLTLREIATNVAQPIYVGAPSGDARLFIVQQGGLIRLYKDGQLQATPYMDLTDRVDAIGDERGLLGLAFHPNFASNGKLYVSYTQDPNGDRVISEFTVNPTADTVANSGERILIDDSHIRDNHNGGAIEFGPDGLLYIAFGDGGGANDSEDGGQNPNTLKGKILRIDVDNGSPYGIPAGNPWAAGGGVPEMFAWGLRNPWRMSFDGEGNLFIGDVGQGAYEEIDLIPAGQGGRNFGWPVFEGPDCFTADDDGDLGCDNPSAYVAPLTAYNRQGTGECTVVAGYAYRGTCMPDLQDVFFYGDYCAGNVRTLVLSGGVATQQQDRTADIDPGGVLFGTLASFGVDGYGELYIAARNSNRVYRIEIE